MTIIDAVILIAVLIFAHSVMMSKTSINIDKNKLKELDKLLDSEIRKIVKEELDKMNKLNNLKENKHAKDKE